MEYAVRTYNISKSYNDRKVVDSVSIHVTKGEIYGFVGANGAGKSTILKMIMGLVNQDEGDIYLFDQKRVHNNSEVLRKIGSIIENPYFYSTLTGKENLYLHGEYMGGYGKNEVEKILNLVSLEDAMDKVVNQYSLGMKQRLAIARAIMTNPELLILDEPINALDPEGIFEIRSLLKRLNKELGTSVLISSHILSEVEQIADTVGVLKQGLLICEEPIRKIRNEIKEYFTVIVNDVNRAAQLIEEHFPNSNLEAVSDSELRIYDQTLSGYDVVNLLITNKIRLESIYKKKNTLEDYFFYMTREA